MLFRSSLTKTEDGKSFEEKKAKIGVYAISTSKKIKALGDCIIDLSLFALQNKPVTRNYKLQNCIDRNASIELEFRVGSLNATPTKPGPTMGDIDDIDCCVSDSISINKIKTNFTEDLNLPLVERMKCDQMLLPPINKIEDSHNSDFKLDRKSVV